MLGRHYTTPRVPMMAMDKRGISALAKCTFLPGEWNKRFAHDLAMARSAGKCWFSEKQRACLWRLIHRYRRQIKDEELHAYAIEQMKLEAGREDAQKTADQAPAR